MCQVAHLLGTLLLLGALEYSNGQLGVSGSENEIHVGWMGPVKTPGDSAELAAFLVATRAINANPERHLGNPTLRVTPHFRATPKNSMQAVRVMDGLVAMPGAYHVWNATATPTDSHVVVLGGSTTDATRLSPIAELNGKPVIGYSAQGDALANKDEFPTFSRIISPDRFAAAALGRVTRHLGYTRVGILRSSSAYGAVLQSTFSRIFGSLNGSVVADFALAPGLNISDAHDVGELTRVAETLREAFAAANVRVYALFAEETELIPLLWAARRAGVIGPDHVVLLHSGVVGMEIDRQHPDAELFGLLDGAVGVFPGSNESSASADEMWSLWPQSNADWATLLNSSPGSVATLEPPIPPLPTIARNELPFLSLYAWDATMVAAKSIADAWTECASPADPDRHGVVVECYIPKLRGTSFANLATGTPLRFSTSGDRAGTFRIVNVVNGTRVTRGSLMRTSSGAAIHLDIAAVVWSDGSTNRTVAPRWGQVALPPTSTTVATEIAADSVTVHSRDATNAIAVGVVLGTLLVVAVLLMAWRNIDARVQRKRPRDFRAVIAALQQHEDTRVSNLDFRTPPRCPDVNSARTDPGAPTEAEGAAQEAEQTGVNVPAELLRKHVQLSTAEDGVLGRGQFGNVYKAQLATSIGRVRANVPVAVKVLHNDASQDSFLTEAAVTWQFNHPNVVQMHGVVTSGLPLMLVLELCERGSLLSFLESTPEPGTPVLVQILADIAAAMAYLASKQFVHRDLAARNILLNAQCQAKVSDFGLGRPTEGSGYYRVASDVTLPVRWTDPWAFKHVMFNEYTDVWSFGVTAIETFTGGARPYGTWSNLMVVESVDEGYRLARPDRMPVSVYNQVVQKCWTNGNSEACASAPSPDGTPAKVPPEAIAEYFRPRPTFAQIAATLASIQDTDAECAEPLPPLAEADDFVAPPPPQRSSGAFAPYLQTRVTETRQLGNGGGVGGGSRSGPIRMAPLLDPTRKKLDLTQLEDAYVSSPSPARAALAGFPAAPPPVQPGVNVEPLYAVHSIKPVRRVELAAIAEQSLDEVDTADFEVVRTPVYAAGRRIPLHSRALSEV